MNCRDWEERIALHAERDLPPREAAEAERHLAECAQCREFAESLTQTLSELRGAHAEPWATADFAAVRARVLAELPVRRRPAWRLVWVGAAAVVLLAASLFTEHRPQPRANRVTPPAPTVEAAVPLPPPPEQPQPTRQTRRAVRPRRTRKPVPPSEPLMVRLISDNPDVVIYWIAN